MSGPKGESRFIYDGLIPILEEGPGSSSGTAYVHGNVGLVARRSLGAENGSMAVAYHGDRQGSVVNLSDGAGAPRGAFGYDAFGHGNAAAGADQEAYRFLGQLGVRGEEGPGELYLMGLRTYDASTGRFISPDPMPGALRSPSTLNPYAYALNNPLRYVDPIGLRAEGDDGLVLISDDVPAVTSWEVPPLTKPEIGPPVPAPPAQAASPESIPDLARKPGTPPVATASAELTRPQKGFLTVSKELLRGIVRSLGVLKSDRPKQVYQQPGVEGLPPGVTPKNFKGYVKSYRGPGSRYWYVVQGLTPPPNLPEWED
jgi:RHS repeat-associated protein